MLSDIVASLRRAPGSWLIPVIGVALVAAVLLAHYGFGWRA